MNKNKLISIIAICLLISNLALVAFILLQNHRPPHHEGPRELIIERLHFDANQVKEYDKLIANHRASIISKNEKMGQLKNQLYSGILKPSTSSDSLKSEIGKLQVEIEGIQLKHFEDINKLCRAEQKTCFNNLVGELARLFNERQRGPRPL